MADDLFRHFSVRLCIAINKFDKSCYGAAQSLPIYLDTTPCEPLARLHLILRPASLSPAFQEFASSSHIVQHHSRHVGRSLFCLAAALSFLSKLQLFWAGFRWSA